MGKQNQDDFFYSELGDGNIVIGVFDGHGRELGQLAANTAKKTIRELLTAPGALDRVVSDPQGVLTEMFAEAHRQIKHVRDDARRG